MKNVFLKFVAVATLLVASTSSLAITTDTPITGSISFKGESTTTVANNEVTDVTFAGATMEASVKTGTFSEVTQTEATFWGLTPSTSENADLWSIGGFTFSITNILLNEVQYGTALIVASGTISADGYETTAATFTYTTQGVQDGQTTLSTFSASAVPAPATIALLGLALVGFGATRRKNQA